MYTSYAPDENFSTHTPVFNVPSQPLSPPLSQSLGSLPAPLFPASTSLRLVFDFLLSIKHSNHLHYHSSNGPIYSPIYSLSYQEDVISAVPIHIIDVLYCLPVIRHHCQQYGGHAYFHSLLFQIDQYDIESLLHSYNHPNVIIERLNAFVSDLNHDLQSYQAHPTHREYTYNSNQIRSMQELLQDAFERYSKVLVLRVDLRYRDDIAVSYEQAKNDIQRFMDSRRFNTLFCNEIGSAYKLERGVNFHFHTLWLLNGNKHQSDGELAKRIGDRWSRMTEGRGIAYNCNYNKHHYQHCGIGMIKRNEPDKREHLFSAAQYLCKEDPLTRAYVPAGHRTFFRSVIR